MVCGWCGHHVEDHLAQPADLDQVEEENDLRSSGAPGRRCSSRVQQPGCVNGGPMWTRLRRREAHESVGSPETLTEWSRQFTEDAELPPSAPCGFRTG